MHLTRDDFVSRPLDDTIGHVFSDDILQTE